MLRAKLLSIIPLFFLLSGCENQEINLSTCQEKVKTVEIPNSFFSILLSPKDSLQTIKCFTMVNKDIIASKEKAEEILKNFKPDSETIRESEEYKKLNLELEIKANEIKSLKEDLAKLKEKTKNPFDAFRKKEQIN